MNIRICEDVLVRMSILYVCQVPIYPYITTLRLLIFWVRRCEMKLMKTPRLLGVVKAAAPALGAQLGRSWNTAVVQLRHSWGAAEAQLRAAAAQLGRTWAQFRAHGVTEKMCERRGM